MSLDLLLGTLNATLNGLSAISLIGGRIAIARGQRPRHRRLMLSAVTISGLFLVAYLTRVALVGTHRFSGTGGWRAFYLFVLGTHMLLAAVTPILALRTLYLALKERFDEHRRLARIAFPIWLYVSVTGVLVFLLLYHGPQ